MAEKKTGLIIGKFAPLHKGHQFLIESALSRCDRLIVLVYDVPELTRIPVEVRMGWIKRLYPGVETVDAGRGPREVGDTPSVNRLHIEYAKSRLPAGVKIDYVFSSEAYGKPLAAALGAQNVVVDRARLNVPVSAGLIRSESEKYKDYVEDFVYEEITHNQQPTTDN